MDDRNRHGIYTETADAAFRPGPEDGPSGSRSPPCHLHVARSKPRAMRRRSKIPLAQPPIYVSGITRVIPGPSGGVGRDKRSARRLGLVSIEHRRAHEHTDKKGRTRALHAGRAHKPRHPRRAAFRAGHMYNRVISPSRSSSAPGVKRECGASRTPFSASTFTPFSRSPPFSMNSERERVGYRASSSFSWGPRQRTFVSSRFVIVGINYHRARTAGARVRARRRRSGCQADAM